MIAYGCLMKKSEEDLDKLVLGYITGASSENYYVTKQNLLYEILKADFLKRPLRGPDRLSQQFHAASRAAMRSVFRLRAKGLIRTTKKGGRGWVLADLAPRALTVVRTEST